jgi:hypothetical protein
VRAGSANHRRDDVDDESASIHTERLIVRFTSQETVDRDADHDATSGFRRTNTRTDQNRAARAATVHNRSTNAHGAAPPGQTERGLDSVVGDVVGEVRGDVVGDDECDVALDAQPLERRRDLKREPRNRRRARERERRTHRERQAYGGAHTRARGEGWGETTAPADRR